MSFRRSILTVEDRISALPDSLICHILSFLPTKLAIATSILSKSWTPLWKSVLTLDLDEDDFKDYGSFRHFVYSVTISRDPTLPLRSFRIRCGNFIDFDPSDLNRVFHAAVQPGLEIFDLELFPMEYDLQKVAPSVLNCRTLVVLKLRNLTIDEIPQLVDLPLLKTLHLDRIYFANHFVHAMNLFNGCPILEDLYTNIVQPYDDWHDLKEEFKGFPNLVRANLHDCELKFPFAWVHNAKFLSAELFQTWAHEYPAAYEYPIPTFHNLTHMELIFYHRDSWPGKWVIQVLQHCPKLQNLNIVQVCSGMRGIEDEDWKDPETVPECLSSQLKTCLLRGYIGNQCELHFAKYIMMNSKLLCTMTIKSIWLVDGNEKHQMQVKLSSYPRASPKCKLLFD